nr:unnamed protein product [Callosobruchus analis]
MFIFKNRFDQVADPLLILINSSLEKGIFPDMLKVATITPNSINAEDLRPINTLPAIEKILEKVAYIQLKQFITSNNSLCKFQSVFRDDYSCETALQYIINQWKKQQMIVVDL